MTMSSDLKGHDHILFRLFMCVYIRTDSMQDTGIVIWVLCNVALYLDVHGHFLLSLVDYVLHMSQTEPAGTKLRNMYSPKVNKITQA